MGKERDRNESPHKTKKQGGSHGRLPPLGTRLSVAAKSGSGSAPTSGTARCAFANAPGPRLLTLLVAVAAAPAALARPHPPIAAVACGSRSHPAWETR